MGNRDDIWRNFKATMPEVMKGFSGDLSPILIDLLKDTFKENDNG